MIGRRNRENRGARDWRGLRGDPLQGRAWSACHVVVPSLCLTRQAVRNGRLLSKSAVRASALGVVELGGANEPMIDATGEEERHPIGIDPPD